MLDEVRTPRLVIAGTASNVGKTILTAGLIAAFKARGLTVQSFKVGPDYIDPAYLAHVSGRPCRNLDSWMLGEGALRQVLAQGALGADLALIEGMLGLFDGRGGSPDGSTADVARIVKAPVVLVPKKIVQGKPAAGPTVRLAVAYDDAFNFYYPENLELLEEHGAQVVPFSPLEDAHLPQDAAGVYLGGGFPESFVEPLARNGAMTESIERAYRNGVPVYAECRGLMYLGLSLRTYDGAHQMARVIPFDVEMDGEIHRFGYL